MPTVLESITAADFPAFLKLNNLAVPHVNALDDSALAALTEQAWSCQKVTLDDRMLGFLVVLTPGQHYQSLNYRWFSDHYGQFAYVDRVVVAEESRGLGLASMLYDDLFDSAQRGGLERLCCEVNLQPPNPASLAFHAQRGFIEVGQQETEGGSKRVSLLVKEFE